MKNGLTAIIFVLVILGLIVLAGSAFVVREDEQVVITAFGNPVRTVTDAGLSFKAPFYQQVRRFDKRILEFDGDSKKIPTNDKKRIYIDTFARWRITDPRAFLLNVRTETTAQSRLDTIIESATRNAIARHLLIETVRNTNRPLTEDKEIAEAQRQMARMGTAQDEDNDVETEEEVPSAQLIKVGREKIMREILDAAQNAVDSKGNKLIEGMGIELVDFKIKRVNYGSQKQNDTGVREKVYERMSSERKQIAQWYRSQGQERHSELLGTIDREKNQIISGAYKNAEKTKGEGEAEAARIYARAYGKDPHFYAFWKTLQIYKETLSNNSTLVISTDSDFFKYLSQAGVVEKPAIPSEGEGE